MIEKRFSFVLLALLLISHAYAVKVQCQNEPSQWRPGQRFQLSQHDVLVPTIYEGVDVFVDDLDGFVSRVIINSGYWQPRNLRNMARFVEPGYTVLNVGSHIGLQSVVMGKALGKNGRLFMFQTYSVSHNLALKNVYFNGLGDIATVFNAGGSSSYSKGVEMIDHGNTGGSRVYPGSNNIDPSRSQQIIVDAIDNVLPTDTVLNFVLIDVERMELEVFLGMKNTILRSPNIIIFCEWSGNYFNQTGEGQKMIEVVNWFVQHKFKFYEMTGGQPRCQYATWIEQTPQQIMAKGNYPDILFVPSHLDPNKIGL